MRLYERFHANQESPERENRFHTLPKTEGNLQFCPVFADDFRAVKINFYKKGENIMSRKKHSTNSLWHQVGSSIRACFSENLDKHSMKSETGRVEDTHHIFSYQQRSDLLDLSDQAFRFVKTHHPEIRYVRDISVEHVNEFLASKAEVCSTATLRQYGTKIRKISRCINYFFGIDTHWEKGLLIPESLKTTSGERQRTQQMSHDDFELIRVKSISSKSRAPIALELSARFGLRVEETAKIKAENIHLDGAGIWGFGQISITGKGGRPRTTDIKSEEDHDFVKRLVDGKGPDERLVNIKKDSVNRFLSRVMAELGIKEKYPVTGVHAIRKMYAQACWDKYRAEGFSVKESIRYVNTQLGHNETRDRQLLSIYVANMW